MTAELFTPTVNGNSYTGGSWRDAGQVSRKRTYHNTAILLADGTVLIGGNAPIPALYNQVLDGPNLPGRPGTNNHHDPSFQVYEPPYIHDPNRPTVTKVDPEPGQLVVHTPQAANIASVVMIRNTAQTHLVDGDAREVTLPIASRNTDGGDPTVTVNLPASTNVMPNGPYLLFANAYGAGHNASPGHVLPSVGVQLFSEGTNTSMAPVVSTVAPPPPAGSAASKTLGEKAIASNTLPSTAPANVLSTHVTSHASGTSAATGSSSGSGSGAAVTAPSSVGSTFSSGGSTPPQQEATLATHSKSTNTAVGGWAVLSGVLLVAVLMFGYSGRRRRQAVV
jgi:hypothetical protein